MNKNELEQLANTLQKAKDLLKQESDLLRKKKKRPVVMNYIDKILIPEIESAYEIFRKERFEILSK